MLHVKPPIEFDRFVQLVGVPSPKFRMYMLDQMQLEEGSSTSAAAMEMLLDFPWSGVTKPEDDIAAQLVGFLLGRCTARNSESREDDDLSVFLISTLERGLHLNLERQRASVGIEKLVPAANGLVGTNESSSVDLQTRLCKAGGCAIVVELLTHCKSELLLLQAVMFGIALLENGNTTVQSDFHKRIQSNEAFFLAFRDRIRAAVEDFTQQKWKAKCGLAEKKHVSDNLHVTKLFRLLQLLCEGHHSQMQNLLREQPLNKKQVNLLEVMVDYLGVTASNFNRIQYLNVHIATQLLDTLTESVQGPCKPNQQMLSKTFLLEYCSRLLHVSEIEYSLIGKKENEMAELKQAVLRVMMSLLEGVEPKLGLQVPARVRETIDSQLLLDTIQHEGRRIIKQVTCLATISLHCCATL